MLTAYDKALANAFELILPALNADGTPSDTGIHIQFQFPPKVVSDSKGASWEEGEQRGNEPLAYFTTTGARKMHLEWTYIIGEDGWDADRIRDQVGAIRRYFYDLAATGYNAAATIKLANHGDPAKAMSARMLDVDIKHGKTYVIPKDDSAIAHSYPLRTDVGVELRLWSRAGDTKAEEKVNLNALVCPVPLLWR